MKTLIPLLFILILASCEYDPDRYLTFHNNSEKAIYVEWTLSYPADSLSELRRIRHGLDEWKIIYPKSKIVLTTGTEKLVSWLGEAIRSDYGYLSFTVMDLDTAKEGDYERVKREYDVLARYDLTDEDLESLNFTLVYPPSEEMAGVHMWIRE